MPTSRSSSPCQCLSRGDGGCQNDSPFTDHEITPPADRQAVTLRCRSPHPFAMEICAVILARSGGNGSRRLSQRRLARVTHSQINLALARPRLRLSLTLPPSRRSLYLHFSLTSRTEGSDGGATEPQNQLSFMFSMLSGFLPPSLPANPPPLRARACYVHSRSPDLREGGGGGDPRG